MLELTVTTTSLEKKKAQLRGRMYYDTSEAAARLVCQLEKSSGDFSIVSTLPMSVALKEPLAATVAKALAEVLCEHDLPPVSLESIQSIAIVGRSFKTEVLETSIHHWHQRLVGKTGHWHDFDDVKLSIWQIAMHGICEIAFGHPLVASQSQIPLIPVYRERMRAFCRTRDLPAEQRRIFEVLYCLSAPIQGVFASDACEANDVDAFMCNYFEGYRYSENRMKFLRSVSREIGT